MRIFKLSAAASVATTIMLALAVFAAPNALAATCSGSACTGKSSSTYGCSSDASTITKWAEGTDVWVEIRYSPTCQAAWARASLCPSTQNCIIGADFDIRRYNMNTGSTLYETGEVDPGEVVNTNMIYVSFATFIEFKADWVGGQGNDDGATPWWNPGTASCSVSKKTSSTPTAVRSSTEPAAVGSKKPLVSTC